MESIESGNCVFIKLPGNSDYENSVQIEKVSGGPVIRALTHFSIEPGWLSIAIGVCPHIRPGFQSSFAAIPPAAPSPIPNVVLYCMSYTPDCSNRTCPCLCKPYTSLCQGIRRRIPCAELVRGQPWDRLDNLVGFTSSSVPTDPQSPRSIVLFPLVWVSIKVLHSYIW